ncbi:MAG: DUF1343 domain-containing protein [Bacteroidales bacterium]|nr:DUF1343 domain-containing protein [Bacteroidales bacterium]
MKTQLILFYIYLATNALLYSCNIKNNNTSNNNEDSLNKICIEEKIIQKPIIIGAEDTASYFKLLKNKKVGLTANATSVSFSIHTLDLMLNNGINVTKIYSPEHGFRGDAEPGVRVNNDIDSKTGVPIVSLFGKNLKPKPEQLKGIDIMVYDMQDVGCRFFTYISTLHNIMEACGECGIPVMVLDRPNPNIDYVAGPIRDNSAISFVSLDPIPIVYGMTVGELANMINFEGWLKNSVKCDLTIIPVKNYYRNSKYCPPVKPSPNLPNYLAIRLYPSLCLFEATSISVGRGTMEPFTKIGYPDINFGEYVFTPQDIKGMQTNPLHKDKKCYGVDFSNANPDTIKFSLQYFINMYHKFPQHNMINRKEWLKLLYGNNSLEKMISEGKSEKEIIESWQPQLNDFKKVRAKYLIYQ